MTNHDRSTETEDRLAIAERQYDPTASGDLATEVVLTVAEAVGVDPQDFRSVPLYESVDTEAVEGLFFDAESTEAGPAVGSVEFSYADHRVRIESDGWITVFDTEDTDGDASAVS
jgi:hypothetical protein